MESQEAAKNIAEIAAVEGVDCMQMGPLELSSDMGLLRVPTDERPTEMLKYAPSDIPSSESLPSSLTAHVTNKLAQVAFEETWNFQVYWCRWLQIFVCLSTQGCEGNKNFVIIPEMLKGCWREHEFSWVVLPQVVIHPQDCWSWDIIWFQVLRMLLSWEMLSCLIFGSLEEAIDLSAAKGHLDMYTLDFIHMELDQLVSVVHIQNFADFYLK